MNPSKSGNEKRRRSARASASADQRQSDEPAKSVIALIRDVQSGEVSAANLSAEDRRLCVAHLTAEGYSVPEIAQVLKCADRTIYRDRVQIRQAHAIEAGPELTREMVGNLLREAEISATRIRRATRGAEVEPQAKIEAEKACWVIARDLVGCLQRLGYLPTAPQTIQGQLVHQVQGAIGPDCNELQEELVRLEMIFAPSGSVGDEAAQQLLEQIAQTKKVVNTLALSEQVRQLTSAVESHVSNSKEDPRHDQG